MAFILDLPATPRYHVYLAFFMFFFFGLPLLAFVWFLAFYCFYFDEMKYECLNFEEYLDDCMDMFQVETEEEVERIFRSAEEIKDYYQKSGKGLPNEYTNYSDSTSGASADFNQNRMFDEWDSNELTFIAETMEWIRDDWEYSAEVELDDTFDFLVGDLEQYYAHFEVNRPRDQGPGLNRFETKSHFFLANTGVSPQTSSHFSGSLLKTNPQDIRFVLSQPLDDFRFPYWTKRFREQLRQDALVKNH